MRARAHLSDIPEARHPAPPTPPDGVGKHTGARPMEMRGRTMEGYVYIDPAVPTNDVLKAWLDEAVAFVKTLPVKAAGAKPKRPG